MWICGPLSGAPPLSSPLGPFLLAEASRLPFLSFLFFFFLSPPHAFPESRYVDSIRLTSHNGEFVQQGEPHYPNPSVALPLFEICAPDWRGLPSVSFRWDKRWIQALPLRFTRPDSSLPMAGLTPAPPKRLHQSAVSLPPSHAARATFSFLRLRREQIEWHWRSDSNPCGWTCVDFPTVIFFFIALITDAATFCTAHEGVQPAFICFGWCHISIAG